MQLYKKLLIILCLNQITYLSYAKVIIWDLGGVLCKISKSKMIKQLGFSSLFGYALFDGNKSSIKPLVFEVLARFEPAPRHAPRAYDNEGMVLPYCLYKVFIGEQSGFNLLAPLQAHIQKLYLQGFFISNREREIIEKSIKILFTPKLFAETIKPNRTGVRLLEKCIRSPKKHKLMILSNWDRDSFALLYNSKHGQKILKYFKPENIVISGNLGYAKPDSRCFEYLIKQYKLDPKECVFIDDQPENIAMAHKFGIMGIYFTNNYSALYNTLASMGIF